MRMEGNLMLERQPPIGGVGPPPPPTGSRGGPPPREYQPFYKFPSAASVQASNPNSNVNSIQRSPRLLITPSSPDNVGPALGRLGRSIGLSVEMLATVGETIGEENPDIRGDMQESCRESRSISSALEKLCESISHSVMGNKSSSSPKGLPLLGMVNQADLEALVRTLRRLLAAVTRILLLADNVVVKQLLVTGTPNSIISTMEKKPKTNVSSNNQVSSAANAVAAANQAGKSQSTMHHFNEFVKAFCDFGSDMVHLIRITTGKGENCPKEERWRSQIDSARVFLQRSSTLLLVSSKTFARHPSTPSARENRDTVFCQMRRALDLIHYIIKEGVVDCTNKFGLDGVSIPVSILSACDEQDSEAFTSTVLRAIKYFQDSVEIMRMSIISESYKDQLTSCLDSIIERTQDFTDSAYTTHEHRQNILLLCERARIELSHVLAYVSNNSDCHRQEGLEMASQPTPSQEVDVAMDGLLKTTLELKLELQQTALELASILLEKGQRAQERVHAGLLNSALTGDFEQLQMSIEKLTEHIDFVEDVAKLVRHVTWTEASQVRAKHAQINLHIYGPQVAVAASTLCQDPHSKVAKDNFETFCGMWQFLLGDVVGISQQVAEQTHAMALQSLPPPAPMIVKEPPTPTSHHSPPAPPQYSPHHLNGGIPNSSMMQQGQPPPQSHVQSNGKFNQQHNKSVPNLSASMADTTSSQLPPVPPPLGRSSSNYLDPGNLMMAEPRRHSTSGVPGYPNGGYNGYYSGHNGSSIHLNGHSRPLDILNSYPDTENNEMVRRAKKMAQQADDMFAFTRGHGKVKTTQDLFTLAEYFAEECNIIYKVIRLFSYDVPSGEDKRLLMALADNVPKHCHQLQMLIQSSTVGKAATFTKVDSIIKETRSIVNLIIRVIQMCYSHSKKYTLDFSNLSLEGKGDPIDTSDVAQFGASRRGTQNAGNGNANKKTRVSFILSGGY